MTIKSKKNHCQYPATSNLPTFHWQAAFIATFAPTIGSMIWGSLKCTQANQVSSSLHEVCQLGLLQLFHNMMASSSLLKGMKHPQRASLPCQHVTSPICPLALPAHHPYLLMRGKTCQLQQPDYSRPMPIPPNLPSIKISRQRLRRARET